MDGALIFAQTWTLTLVSCYPSTRIYYTIVTTAVSSLQGFINLHHPRKSQKSIQFAERHVLFLSQNHTATSIDYYNCQNDRETSSASIDNECCIVCIALFATSFGVCAIPQWVLSVHKDSLSSSSSVVISQSRADPGSGGIFVCNSGRIIIKKEFNFHLCGIWAISSIANRNCKVLWDDGFRCCWLRVVGFCWIGVVIKNSLLRFLSLTILGLQLEIKGTEQLGLRLESARVQWGRDLVGNIAEFEFVILKFMIRVIFESFSSVGRGYCHRSECNQRDSNLWALQGFNALMNIPAICSLTTPVIFQANPNAANRQLQSNPSKLEAIDLCMAINGKFASIPGIFSLHKNMSI